LLPNNKKPLCENKEVFYFKIISCKLVFLNLKYIIMSKTSLLNSVSWLVGFVIFIIGVLNILRGNDPYLGVGFMLISFLYVPSTNHLLKKKFGFSIHYILKIILVVFLLWIALSVGAIAEGFYPEILS